MPLLLAGGAVCNAVTAQGSFTPSDVYYAEGNINVLELLAVYVKYGLQSFASIIKNRHILVRCDNSTAVSYISNMGGTHSRALQCSCKRNMAVDHDSGCMVNHHPYSWQTK